jgi:hypothetical protein
VSRDNYCSAPLEGDGEMEVRGWWTEWREYGEMGYFQGQISCNVLYGMYVSEFASVYHLCRGHGEQILHFCPGLITQFAAPLLTPPCLQPNGEPVADGGPIFFKDSDRGAHVGQI